MSIEKYSHLPRTAPDARALGVTRFFTGKPCKRGHIAPRKASSQNCIACRKESDATEEEKAKRAAYAKRYCEKNADAISLNQKRYYRLNAEKISARTRKYEKDNAAKVAEKRRDYYRRNVERKLAVLKKWKERNPEKLEAIRKRHLTKHIVNARNYHSRKRGAEGRHTAKDIELIREQQGDACAYCKTRLNGKGDVDHILALSKGGSNWPENLQLLCHLCNCIKGARDHATVAERAQNGMERTS